MIATTTELKLSVLTGDVFHTILCDAELYAGRIYLFNCRVIWRGRERSFDVNSLRERNADAVYTAAADAFRA